MAGIEVVNIAGAERDRLLSLEEGDFIDLKAIEILPKKLSKHISAFANSSGGDLYIGVDEFEFLGTKVRHWRGFADQEAANGHLQGLDALFPLGGEFSYEFLRVPGSPGLVLHVTVQKTSQITKAQDDKAYVRRGAQSLPVTGSAALNRLKLDKGVDSFERHPVNVSLDIVAESEILQKFVTEVVPTTLPLKYLRKQSLVKGNKPVVAAVLLFSDEPQAALPKRSGIKLYRYKTNAKVGSRDTLAGDPVSLEGSLYDLIKLAVNAPWLWWKVYKNWDHRDWSLSNIRLKHSMRS